jgi:uncharacterized membrane protein
MEQNTVRYYIKLYFITLIAFFVIDMVWLGLIARTLYRNYLGFWLASTTNWFAVILFYLLFILGILVFVVLPGLENNSLKETLLRAALFGLITYATYDLTNLATVKNWPVLITVIDMAWGTILSVLVSYISFMVGTRLILRNNQ